MDAGFDIAGVSIRVVRKAVRHLHLSVLPPEGAVRITAPVWMDSEAIQLFAVRKLGWIRRQQKRMRGQEREARPDYVERESHQAWGRRYLLRIVEHNAAPSVETAHRWLVMRVRPGADRNRREDILYDWYRSQLREVVAVLLEKWCPIVGARPARVYIQRMKTRWGSCNPARSSIRLNAELAKKPVECLEYVLVHELIHLLEPGHGPGFIDRMDQALPLWRDRRQALNEFPIRDCWGEAGA